MSTFTSELKCECGQRYYYIVGACYLDSVNSKVAKNWYGWAMQFNQPVCIKAKCKARTSAKGCVATRGLEGKEREFVKYIQTAMRSKWQSKERKKAPGKTTDEQYNKIAILQNFECYFCLLDLKPHPHWFDPSERGKIAHWDHLQPISKKGSSGPINMALTCRGCNMEKNNMTEREYWEYLKTVKSEELILKIKALRENQAEEKSKL